MHATYDLTDEIRGTDLFLADADVAGLYPPDAASAASRTTMTDQGSGNWRVDD